MELRDELLDSLILDNTYIKLEDLDKKDKLEKIIPIVKDIQIAFRCVAAGFGQLLMCINTPYIH